MLLLENRHIFIVEDNIQNRVVFQMSLMRHGATVTFERWGGGTMDRLASTPCVELILLDLMLADSVSGFDVYDDIRNIPQFRYAPIVAVSAMDAALAIPTARKKGFTGFIPKPINKAIFPQQIAKILSGEQLWNVSENASLRF